MKSRAGSNPEKQLLQGGAISKKNSTSPADEVLASRIIA
jgi:hypothetical protein